METPGQNKSCPDNVRPHEDEYNYSLPLEVTLIEDGSSGHSDDEINSCGTDDVSVHGWMKTPSVWSVDEIQAESANFVLPASNQSSATGQHCQLGSISFSLSPWLVGMPWSVYDSRDPCTPGTSWPETEQCFAEVIFQLPYRRLLNLVRFSLSQCGQLWNSYSKLDGGRRVSPAHCSYPVLAAFVTGAAWAYRNHPRSYWGRVYVGLAIGRSRSHQKLVTTGFFPGYSFCLNGLSYCPEVHVPICVSHKRLYATREDGWMQGASAVLQSCDTMAVRPMQATLASRTDVCLRVPGEADLPMRLGSLAAIHQAVIVQHEHDAIFATLTYSR